MSDLAQERREVLEVALRVQQEAEEEHGHDLHVWARKERGVGQRTACRKCGGILDVSWDDALGGVVVGGANIYDCEGEIT